MSKSPIHNLEMVLNGGRVDVCIKKLLDYIIQLILQLIKILFYFLLLQFDQALNCLFIVLKYVTKPSHKYLSFICLFNPERTFMKLNSQCIYIYFFIISIYIIVN